MAIIKVSNTVQVGKQEVDLRVIQSQFTHPNPKFSENMRLGFSNFGVPRDIPLYQENGDYIYFPRGLIGKVAALGPDFTVEDKTVTAPAHFKPSDIVLKPYQVPALDALLKRNQGVLEAPPGSGKTVIGLEAIIRRSQRALVLVHTKDLLRQWCDRLEHFCDMQAGIIDADKHDLRDITIAMVQSLRRPLDESFLKQFGTVILDEAHHAPAFTFEQLINQFPAKFRYGLTATPVRRDGLSFVLHAVLGATVYKIEQKGLFDAGEIMRPTIRVVKTGLYNPLIEDYRTLLECAVNDAERNTAILRRVIKEAVEGHYCLVLSNRIDHAGWLHQSLSMVRSDIRSECLTSKVAKETRTEIIDQMNRGEIKVLFATQLADEGLDMRRLDRLFLTCPIRSTNRVNQQIGRILRTFPGKEDAVVYDFRDNLLSLAESQYQTRFHKIYKPNGYTVEESGPDVLVRTEQPNE